MQAEPVLLNLGCGSRYHPGWRNIDIVSTGPGVMAHDLSRGIPFPDGTAHAVYHSHLIEHLRRRDASLFVRECWRVLKPGGTLRVATPNLEVICLLYLEKLRAALDGDARGRDDYDWMMLELYDQTVRESKGGEMLQYLAQRPLPNEAFIFGRIGEEGRELATQLGQQPAALVSRIWRRGFSRALSIGIARVSSRLAAIFIRGLFGRQAGRAFAIGQMRLSGEVHQWMYDRWSLRALLVDAGFETPVVRAAAESDIPGWSTYCLDVTPEGAVRKPDSLFMEATKPVTAIPLQA